jgi:hypothetical protein
MSTLAHRPAAFAVQFAESAAAPACPMLRPTEDGWSLVAPTGELLFRGLGLRARRECLEYARDHGVLAVMS